MKERPILFSAPMVKAILDGRKTVTRRVVKPQPTDGGLEWVTACGGDFAAWEDPRLLLDEHSEDGGPSQRKCPYGEPGSRLWVRETFCPIYPQDPHYNGGRPIEYDYQATYKHGDRLGDLIGAKKKWKPSIHMPRAASRITLEVTGVRVERLQDISEADAAAEGITPYPGHPGRWLSEHRPGLNYPSAIAAYRDLWESINGPSSWDANPWVWVVEFKRVKGGAA